MATTASSLGTQAAASVPGQSRWHVHSFPHLTKATLRDHFGVNPDWVR
jgi:hypothetical protein